ncbi:MAG: hypothetical protein ACOCRK_11595 [bacterium]
MNYSKNNIEYACCNCAKKNKCKLKEEISSMINDFNEEHEVEGLLLLKCWKLSKDD